MTGPREPGPQYGAGPGPHPPSGDRWQQQAGQWQPGYGSYGGHTPPDPAGHWQYGPYGAGAPPPPQRPGRVIALVLAGAVILAGAGVGIAAAAGAFTGGSDAPVPDEASEAPDKDIAEPEPVATSTRAPVGSDQDLIQARIAELAMAYNSRDVAGFAGNFCSLQRVQLEQLIESTEATPREIFPGDSVRVDGIVDIIIEGDEATAEVEMTMVEEGGEEFSGVEIHELTREDGDWLICG